MRRPTVLIVDDEDIVLRSLKAELKETLGDAYRIDVAETAEEALEVVDEVLAEAPVHALRRK